MATMGPRFVAYCIWDGTFMGLGKLWGGTWESSLDWAKQNHIKFIANFSCKNLDHVDGIPHVWVNIGYKGDTRMPHGTWEERVTIAFSGMVEALSRGCDVLGQCIRVTSCGVSPLMAVMPGGDVLEHTERLTDDDLTKIMSMWDHTVSRIVGLRFHRKIAMALLDDEAQVRGQGSTVGEDSNKDETCSVVSASSATSTVSGSVAVEIMGKQKQNKQTQTSNLTVRALAPTSKSKALSIRKKVSEQAQRNKIVEQKGVLSPPSEPKKLLALPPMTIAFPMAGSKHGSKHGPSSSEEYYYCDSASSSSRSKVYKCADDGSVHATPRYEEKGRSEDSSRVYFSREPPCAQSRSRSEHRRRGVDNRDDPRRGRPRSVSASSSGQRSTADGSREVGPATTPLKPPLKPPRRKATHRHGSEPPNRRILRRCVACSHHTHLSRSRQVSE